VFGSTETVEETLFHKELTRLRKETLENMDQIGGKVSKAHKVWEEIVQDKWVCNIVKNGFPLEMLTEPTPNPTEKFMMSEDDQKILDLEVQDLLHKGAIEECFDNEGVYSPMFVVPKKNGKKRPVWDGRYLNSFHKKEHFQMEGLMVVRELLERGDYGAVIDLKDAYFHLLVAVEHRDYLRFHWKGRKFRFRAMLFGLTSSPRIFTKVMRPVIAMFRKQGIRMVHYIDDILVLGRTKQECQRNILIVLKTLIKLGWTINWDKSKLVPSQTFEYLGLKVDSYNMKFKVPRDKLVSIKKDIQMALNKVEQRELFTLREVARIIGKLIAIELAILPAKLKTRELLRTKNSHLDLGWEGKIQLSEEAINELKWWRENLFEWNGRAIILGPPQVKIQSDASKKGWGAVCGEKETQGFWSTIERNYGNNVKELLAGTFGVQSFEEDTAGKIVQMEMDNTSAISYINKMGGRVSLLSKIAQEFWEWCLDRGTVVTATYLPGKLNTKADKLSRQISSHNDWKLNPKAFQVLQQLRGPFDIDLFASRVNKQVERFFSWKPEPGAEAVDAFRQPWKRIKGWANPPFNLIGRVLSKVKKEKANLTLVAPIWPAQSWFPILLEMLSAEPIMLPDREDLFLPGFLGSETPLRNPNWKVAVWSISGDRNMVDRYQREPSDCWSKDGKRLLTSTMTHVGDFSQDGGINRTLETISFLHLDW